MRRMILNLCILRMFEDNFTYGAANKTFIQILNDVKIMHGFGNDLFQDTQQAHDVITTSPQRRCNVMALHRR